MDKDSEKRRTILGRLREGEMRIIASLSQVQIWSKSDGGGTSRGGCRVDASSVALRDLGVCACLCLWATPSACLLRGCVYWCMYVCVCVCTLLCACSLSHQAVPLRRKSDDAGVGSPPLSPCL